MTNGLTVAAPFGGGGVSDVTYDTANADEMQVLISGGLGEAETEAEHQHRPEVGRQPVPWRRLLQHLGRLGHVQQCRRPAAQLRDHAAADASDQLGRQFQHRRSHQARSVVVLRQRSRLGQRQRHRRHLRQPVRRRRLALGFLARYVNRVPSGRGEKDHRRASDRADHAAQPRDVLARLPASLRRIDVARRRRRLPSGGRRLDRVGPDVRSRYRVAGNVPRLPQLPANTTQATYSAPISSRTLIEAGYSRFTYEYARFGQAAPDGLMDLIPVTDQQPVGAAELLVSRRLRSARLRLQRQRRAEFVVARGGLVRDRRAQHEGRLQRDLHRGAQRPRAESHAARYTFNGNAPASAACPAGALPRLCPTAGVASSRRAGINTIARRRWALRAGSVDARAV